jgi:hypothetical protein
VVVYKVDRLTRSVSYFARIAEILDARGVSFVSVTQQFNGRLTLNVRLSFLPGSSARSLPNASATRLRPPRRRACGWAGSCRSATTLSTGSSSQRAGSRNGPDALSSLSEAWQHRARKVGNRPARAPEVCFGSTTAVDVPIVLDPLAELAYQRSAALAESICAKRR